MARPNKEELTAVLTQRDAEQLEKLADHPNPAISVWKMLPGRHYGAVFETTKRGKLGKLIGYEIKNLVGTPKLMPPDVAKRLADDGKIYRLLGKGWVNVNERWTPSGKAAR